MKPTLSERIVILETQVHRIVSDIESEKGTRSRANSNLDDRLRKVERTIYLATGGLAVLNIILAWFR